MQYRLNIEVSLYEFTCHVVFASDIEKVINAYFKRTDQPLLEEGAKFCGLASAQSMKDYYIFYSLNLLDANTITHEITHIVDQVFEDRVISNEGEARAYLTGYISGKIFDYVFKKKINISKWLKYAE